MEQFKIGSKIRLSIEVKTDEFTMDDYDFTAKFYTASNGGQITVNKAETSRESENKYIALIDTAELIKVGIIRCEFTAIIASVEGETKYTMTWQTDVTVVN